MPRDIPSPGPGGGAGTGVAAASGLLGLLLNAALWSGLLSCIMAQLAKVLTHYKAEGAWVWGRALSSGGMPSSHTALVVGVTTAIAYQAGTGSPLFALALVVTLVVAYDATGVRLHAGQHAALLNVLVAHLPPEHPAALTGVLADTLGHTPAEVAVGAVVGFFVASLLQLLHSL